MKLLSLAVKALSHFLCWISCSAIVAIVFLTVVDVILRRVRHPIDFTFEIIVFLAAIVIGFALPRTSLDKGHVTMEFVTSKVSDKWAKVLFVSTRLMATGMFAIIGWNIILYAGRLRVAGQSSAILKIPEFFVTYAVAFACLVQCLVPLVELFDSSKGVSS
jgi:TRAP-type transport system small permease protein